METKLSAEHPFVTNSVEFIQGLKDKLFPDPFAAEKAVIKENREGQIGGEITDKENWVGPVIKDAATDVLTQVAVGSAFKKPSPKVLRTYPPELTGTTTKGAITSIPQTRIDKFKPGSSPYTSKLNTAEITALSNLKMKLDSSLSGSQGNRRDWSKYERDQKAYFLEQRWPRDKEFNELGEFIKKELETLYPDIPLSSWKKHHTNPVAQGAKLLNGLKPEYREKGVQIMLEEGISAGHNPAQLNMIPQEIHTKIHRFINSYIGSRYSVRNLEVKYFNGADISTIPWEQRKIAIKEYSNVIRESNEKIYDLMTALAVNKKYGPNVLPEVLAKLNSKVDDPSDIGLDKHIEDIRGELARQEVEGTVPKINLKELIKKAPKDIDPKALKALRLAAKEGLSSVKALKESKYGKQLEFVFKKIETFEQLNLDL